MFHFPSLDSTTRGLRGEGWWLPHRMARLEGDDGVMEFGSDGALESGGAAGGAAAWAAWRSGSAGWPVAEVEWWAALAFRRTALAFSPSALAFSGAAPAACPSALAFCATALAFCATALAFCGSAIKALREKAAYKVENSHFSHRKSDSRGGKSRSNGGRSGCSDTKSCGGGRARGRALAPASAAAGQRDSFWPFSFAHRPICRGGWRSNRPTLCCRPTFCRWPSSRPTFLRHAMG